MRVEEAQILIKELFEKHHLTSWKFELDSATSRFGVCKKKKRIISMSRKLIELNTEPIVKDVMLHEIAHALVRIKHHHDKVWKKKALEIGCNGKMYYDPKEVILPPRVRKYDKGWTATCPKCGKQYTYLTKRTKLACKNCCNAFNNGKYSADYLFTWKLNEGSSTEPVKYENVTSLLPEISCVKLPLDNKTKATYN